MKLIKRMATALVALTIVFAFSSCEKQVTKDTSDLAEVSFLIDNVTNTMVKKVTGEPRDGALECVDGATATRVMLEILPFGTGDPLSFDLDVLALEDGNQTEVVKLPPGTHTISSFVVYDGETPIYAAPMEGSEYQMMFDLDGAPKDFETVAFMKNKVTIEVLCYRPYDYEEFGFNWFEFAPIEIKTVCFFGNICDADYAAWGAEGYDFTYPYTVNIWSTDEEGAPAEIINTVQTDGTAPVCAEYPDYVNVEGEAFYAQIVINGPDGEKSFLVPFTDADWSDPANNDFGGVDGIYDFIYSPDGLCDGEYTDSDAVWVDAAPM